MLERKACDLPKRDMLFEGALERGKTSLVSGHGGSMKTQMLLCIALAAALGVPFGPFRPTRPHKVLYVGVEDDAVEIERRIRAALRSEPFRGLKLEDPSLLWTTGAFHVSACDALELFKFDPESFTVVDGGSYSSLMDDVRRLKPDLLIIDPLVEVSRGCNENDNAQAQAIMAWLRSIAREHKLHLSAAHHWSKQGNIKDHGAARGGSALVNSARYVVNLGKPDKIDGVKNEELHGYVAMYVPKANAGPTGTEALFGIETYDVGNGERIATIEPRERAELAAESLPSWLSASLPTSRPGGPIRTASRPASPTRMPAQGRPLPAPTASWPNVTG
jgi:RecA-family ATPase